jgi:hypothetical protein
MTEAPDSGLGQQLLNNHFRLFVFALAELMMSNIPLRIDEIEDRPTFVLESTPYRMVIIDRDRITARRTLSTFFSNANSGACTPIETCLGPMMLMAKLWAATAQSEKLSSAPARAHIESLGTLSTDGGRAGCDTNLAGRAVS